MGSGAKKSQKKPAKSSQHSSNSLPNPDHIKIGKAPSPQYEAIHQLIHNAPNEFLRQKWKDALAALEARDKKD